MISAMTLSSVMDDGLLTDRSVNSPPVSSIKHPDVDPIPKLKLATGGGGGGVRAAKTSTGGGNRGETTSLLEEDEMIPPPNGRLAKSLVTRNLSNLGRAGDGTTFAYRDLELINLNLSDIGALSSFQFIRHLNISQNKLKTLVVLSNMPWLVTLIASNNELETLLDFTAPKALRHVDLSHNQIRVMSDLGEHQYIETLNLDHNNILMIGGLENCRRLKELRLSHNRIAQLDSLGRLPIQKLDLSYNQLTKIECLDGLELLSELDLSGNRIRSLSGLNAHNNLARLDLSSNEIIDIGELEQLRNLFLLNRGEFSLNLANNPLCELPDFRLYVVFRYPNLAVLNKKRVRTDERTAAIYTFSPSVEHVAAVNHSILAVYSFLQPAVLETYTLPDAEMCYPMLVIVGPDGAGREYLTMRLANEFPDVFSAGALCTSRSLYADEMDGREFAHIPMELFDSQVKGGQFLSIYNLGSQVYGFHKQSLEQAAASNTACVTHMELEGMLCMRLVPSLRPRYVLVVPLDAEIHDTRLRGRGVYNDQQIQDAMKKREFCIQYHQSHPGYFDAVISTNDLEEGYVNLKRLVLDYLGRSVTAVPETAAIAVESKSEVDAALAKTIMAGSLVQRNDGAWSPTNSNTLGTERSLYRVRYEALQRVMSGNRKTSGLQELMSPRKQLRQSQSAGGRNVLPAPSLSRKSPSSTLLRTSQNFGVASNGNVEVVQVSLSSNDPSNSGDKQQPPRCKTIVINNNNNNNNVPDYSTSEDEDLLIASNNNNNNNNNQDDVRPSSGASGTGRLGSARYNVLPPIRSVSEQTPADSAAKMGPGSIQGDEPPIDSNEDERFA